MWCAVGVSVYPSPVDCQEIKFPASEMTSLNKEEKYYCSVQDDFCHESQLRFDFHSVLFCQCVDEDECGRVESPSCARFKSVIVFFEAFELLTKPMPDLLCRRDWLVSFSSDSCMFVKQSFAFVLRFFSVSALIHWSLNAFFIQRTCPGFCVLTSFLPCSHVGIIFQCACIILNDLFLSPPNI